MTYLFNFNFSTKWCNSREITTTLLWSLLYFFTLFQIGWQSYSPEQVKVKIAGSGNLCKTALKLCSPWVTVGLKYKNEFFRLSSWAAVAYGVKRKHNSRKCSCYWMCVALSPVTRAVEEAPSFLHSSCLFSFSPAGIPCTVPGVTL